MAFVTLHILDGADRGRVYEDLQTPITIGREEGNTVQLNDERISRYHLKIQEDLDKLVLTDLESTNGTRVNGEDTQLHILRYGDLITVGRSVLLVGKREQIAERLASIRQRSGPDGQEPVPPEIDGADLLDLELNWAERLDSSSPHLPLNPPDLPEKLAPAQLAELGELLSYLHVRIRQLIHTVKAGSGERVTLEQRQWQNLLDLQNQLAHYLRNLSEPTGDEA